MSTTISSPSSKALACRLTTAQAGVASLVPLTFPDLSAGRKRTQTNRMTEEQFTAWDRMWREFQWDLAKVSKQGKFRLAEKSGHFIHRDQPELVFKRLRRKPDSLIH